MPLTKFLVKPKKKKKMLKATNILILPKKDGKKSTEFGHNGNVEEKILLLFKLTSLTWINISVRISSLSWYNSKIGIQGLLISNAGNEIKVFFQDFSFLFAKITKQIFPQDSKIKQNVLYSPIIPVTAVF